MSSQALPCLIAIGAALLLVGGCPSTEPPAADLPPNTPAVPLPTYAGEALPATSEILVYQEAAITDFEPQLNNVPQSCIDANPGFVSIRFDPLYPRKLMVQDGVLISPGKLHIHCCLDAGCGAVTQRDWDGPMLAELPKIRWVRYWKKLVSVVVPYPTSYEQSHTYTEGTSETTGESFSISLGLSASGWGLGLSAELTYAFSHEVTISSESSVTKTFTCSSEAGKQIQFTVWQLVDGFRICNADGSSYTDPVYDFWSALGVDNETDQLYMSVVRFPD